ncbi:hypothetical protein SAMN05444920_104537 [Nonomuraea solani]|uniref:Uncharacterized protein n=1 Tax=Nonomuraea solani TaxID=1144553 RepID=A0A1H6CYF3_9ACTN|nr:hypothetical protein SAMN05444920_104537 [Nonomuraea solani]
MRLGGAPMTGAGFGLSLRRLLVCLVGPLSRLPHPRRGGTGGRLLQLFGPFACLLSALPGAPPTLVSLLRALS